MEFFEEPETGPDSREDELLLSLSVHDPKAFEILVDRYQKPFLRKAESILRNRESAEDAVQDAFTKIYVYAHTYSKQEGASFKSWAYKILLNTCLTEYQKIKRTRQGSAEWSDELESVLPDANMQAETEKKYDLDYLVSLLSRLPEVWGRLLRLHYIEGKSQEDIARSEGISPGALRVRIHRAKKELKKISDSM